jgi:hypothetical protein
MSPRSHGPHRSRAAAGVLSLALGLGLAGCDDFLATQPRGELTTGQFFTTSAHAVEATNATYAHLRSWGVHVFSWIGMTEIASDDADKGSTPADAANQLQMDNLQWDAGTSNFADTWTSYYQGIFRANVAIENIPGIAMNETLRARLVGENKFLRAYYYFFLVRAYGGVPLITRPLAPGEYQQQRASAQEVYSLIKQDLQDAIAALPERNQYPAADLGRATRGAARALLAQVHLYQGEYQEAYARATEVIGSGQYSLFPDYAAIFTRAGENSSESVFEVQAVALDQGGAGSQYSQVQGVRGFPNLGWGFNAPSQNLQAAFEPGDPRLQATILFAWEQLPDGSQNVVYFNPTTPTNQYNEKVFLPVGNPGGSGNGGVNIRRIRYADVLLMAAEAAYRTNRVTEAQALLNQVRARARGQESATLGFSPEQMYEPIATGALGLDAGTSRVFVRYANPASPAHAAGLRSFEGVCGGPNNTCPTGPAIPPVRVVNADIIQSVGGTPVTTLASFRAAVNAQATGAPVAVQVLRVTQPTAGNTQTQDLTFTVPVQAMLPAVTATGQALLDAIWHERRVELAMEQHRWFDIVRQGRAAEVMAAHGRTFQPHHALYPIPLVEIQTAGLQQNPGY